LAAGNFTHAAAQPVAAEDLLSRVASRRPGARDHETKTLKSTSKDHAIAPRPINQGAAQGTPALFCLEMIGASAGCHPQHQALARAQPSARAQPRSLLTCYAAASRDRCYTTAASETDSAHRDGETQRQRYARGARARGKTGDSRQKRRRRLTRRRRCRPQMTRARQTDNYIKRYAAAGTFASVVKVGLLATSYWTKCVHDRVDGHLHSTCSTGTSIYVPHSHFSSDTTADNAKLLVASGLGDDGRAGRRTCSGSCYASQAVPDASIYVSISAVTRQPTTPKL